MVALRLITLKSKVPEFLIRNCKQCSFQNILYILRMIYVAIGTVVVCYGFQRGYKKFISHNIVIKEQVYTLDKMRYPSITFCYKFKHGSKDVIQSYYPFLFQMAEEKGIKHTFYNKPIIFIESNFCVMY